MDQAKTNVPAFTPDNPSTLYSQVIYRGENCEVCSAPKHANGTIRVCGTRTDAYVPLEELEAV